MKKNKLKITLIVLITAILCLSVGAYAGYTLTATEVSYTKADGTTISVKQALDELHEKSTTSDTATTGRTLQQFDWDELSTIAKMISNNSSITSDTEEVCVALNGKVGLIGVGDTTKVDGKTVRILGFNHDTLTNASAYGTTTATGKAGISFEYVDFINVDGNGTRTAVMNSNGYNTNGWGASELRSILNSTTKNSLSIKDKIKQVNKEFIKTYNEPTSIDEDNPSTDYLWLLSCGEIWGEKGLAIATEGSQYKYYKLGNPGFNSRSDYTKKPNTSSPLYWWLRSPYSSSSSGFCYVSSNGHCDTNYASSFSGVAPGFCI